MTTTITPPRVNGIALAGAPETLSAEELRQRACAELLRQAAIRDGLLAADDPPPVAGAMSEAASDAVEAWLARELKIPEPSDEACRRHHAEVGLRAKDGLLVTVRLHDGTSDLPGDIDLSAIGLV